MGVGSLYSKALFIRVDNHNIETKHTKPFNIVKNSVFQRSLILSEWHLLKCRDRSRNITSLNRNMHSTTEFIDLILPIE